MKKKTLSYLVGLAAYIVIVVCLILLCIALNLLDNSSNWIAVVIAMVAGKIVADVITFAIEKGKGNKNN